MKWISEFYKKYQFQLWMLGCADEKALKRFLRNTYKLPSKKHIQTEILNKIIATDPQYAYLYAMYILNAPWPIGEKAIASNPFYAYFYADDIIKDQWPPGEKAIATSPYFKNLYEAIFKVKL